MVKRNTMKIKKVNVEVEREMKKGDEKKEKLLIGIRCFVV